MKILFFLLPFILWVSCKEIGDAIYEPPVINSFDLIYQEPVLPLDTVTAVVNATNPEKGALSYSWSIDPDEFEVYLIPPLNENIVKWVAPFEGGVYTITATVKNDKKKSSSKDITVQSLEKPYVKINTPKSNDFFVTGEQIEIEANAFHPNHLTQVWLQIDSVYIDNLDYNSSNQYMFFYTPDSAKKGPIEIKVIAEANTIPAGNIGSDFIIVSIEPILPKSGKP